MMDEQLPTGKAMVIVFDEADYDRLILLCDKKQISPATYIEDAVINTINDETQTRETWTE